MYNIIVFGPPGSGKGTQSKNLVREYGLVHLSTGQKFRMDLRDNSAIDELINKFMSRGYLVPDYIVLRSLFKTALQHQQSKGLIFDGFPRNKNQAVLLKKILNKKGMKIDKVISLEVEEEELIRRIMRRARKYGRTDDVAEVIHNRFVVYEAETLQLKEYYKKAGILCSVSGMAPIPVVFERIKRCINYGKAIKPYRGKL